MFTLVFVPVIFALYQSQSALDTASHVPYKLDKINAIQPAYVVDSCCWINIVNGWYFVFEVISQWYCVIHVLCLFTVWWWSACCLYSDFSMILYDPRVVFINCMIYTSFQWSLNDPVWFMCCVYPLYDLHVVFTVIFQWFSVIRMQQTQSHCLQLRPCIKLWLQNVCRE